jgi:hypothetical protein
MMNDEHDKVRPSKFRVLLLASYCGGDTTECSDEFPCAECLQMNNVAVVSGDAVRDGQILGGFDYLKTKPV